MLLNISVRNFRSYDDVQTLSLIANDDSEINAVKVGEFMVRKSAVIYGANASGKSNIIKAIEVFILLMSRDVNAKIWGWGGVKLYDTFFYNQEPTEFTLDLEVNGEIYSYKISFTNEQIYSEQLLDSNEQIIFSRELIDNTYDYKMNQPEIFLDAEQLTVKDDILKAWKLTTTEKQLFLRRCAESGSKTMSELRQAIVDMKIRTNSYGRRNNVNQEIFRDREIARDFYQEHVDPKQLVKIFNAIGASFTKLENEEFEVTSGNEEKRKIRLIVSHYLHNNQDVRLDFWDESDGTVKFYDYFALINQAVKTGGIVIIDELEAHFHPLLVEELIKAVHDSESRVQLIFTTHNPLLLNQQLFERDQVYFANKNIANATELYSLADFTDLNDSDNLLANYLTGNFGAIPYINYLDFNGKDDG